MSKIGKRVEKLRQGNQDIPKEAFFPILDEFFPGAWDFGKEKDSHQVKIKDPLLEGETNFGPGGTFTFPLKGGQTIKPIYIKRLHQAIDLIESKKKGEKT